MEVREHIKLENWLFQKLGEKRVNEIANLLIEDITKYNLDVTPITLEEVFIYVKNIILLRKT